MPDPSASNTILETNSSLVPTPPTGNLPAVVTVVLPPEKAGAVSDLAERFTVMKAEPHVLITFGQEAIGSFGARLDEILSQITNAESPVLFELFRTIRDGVNDADLKDLETSIREKLKGSFMERVLMAIGLGDPAKRLKKVTDEVRGMLQSKAKSLGDLITPMERQIDEESGKLIGEVSRMSVLASGYRDRGMGAYSELQQAEFAAEVDGYTATRHQREVGTGYFDAVSLAITAGRASTTAMAESTETEQFLTAAE